MDSISYKQHLSFRVQGARYALALDHVRELIDCGPVTPVPLMPSFVLGIVNVRGCMVPVIDLAARLDLPPTQRSKRSCVVVAEALFDQQSHRIGLLVEAVETVLDVHADDISPAPVFGSDIRQDFIAGVLNGNPGDTVILDLQQLVMLGDLQPIFRAAAP
ncbi:chemotaxis protein CheW [Stutzerimonas stutzeri]|uniref:Chemotaxis protein CheW n=1 Tax=Stutzerimonas stutzeri TaxID=316 RepID=W8QXL4_STUST|nr:chemotaxis protein CheW [Stutzerimonas stutzeri]AHL75375.1 chemotaxis protein CheW [Stutzerimonas stutzeri]MCQ4328069.1 chemotaxis protein CheW [Stutzerimonas stutzeri]